MAKKSRRRRERSNAKQQLRARQMECEQECLRQWLPEEAMNCIHTCRSPICFEQIYSEPLEPGQIDLDKAGQFNKCTLTEILDLRRKEREERIQSKSKQDDMTISKEDDIASHEVNEES